jgi:hypothetical protein
VSNTPSVKLEPMLRVKIEKTDDLYEGYLLELNLVVSGLSVDEVCEEVEHAITVAYHAAVNEGQAPFVSMISSPNTIDETTWRYSEHESREMNVSNEVMQGLATAFRF